MADNGDTDLNETDPTEAELQEAIKRTKAKGYTNTKIQCDDAAMEVLRGCLPPRCHHCGLSRLRQLYLTLSRAGKEPGERKRKPSDNVNSSITRIVQAYPPSKEHTEAYYLLHESPEFRALRGRLIRELDFTCQLCTRRFLSSDLHAHILDYERWRNPGMVLILCGRQCHGIADALRRRGQGMEALDCDQAACGIFDLAESPPPAEEEEEIRF